MNHLHIEFERDKTTKTVFIDGEINAEISLVWNTISIQKILDQCWAPKPYLSITKPVNCEVGGRRLYAMVSSEVQDHYAIRKYDATSPKSNFEYLNAFAHKDENHALPGSARDFNFKEPNGKTKVSKTIYNDALERMEQMIQMGFKEGFTVTFNDHDNLIPTLKK